MRMKWINECEWMNMIQNNIIKIKSYDDDDDDDNNDEKEETEAETAIEGGWGSKKEKKPLFSLWNMPPQLTLLCNSYIYNNSVL